MIKTDVCFDSLILKIISSNIHQYIALLGCVLVPSMKSVGQIGFETWTQVYLISRLTLKFDRWPWVKVNEKYIIKYQSSCFTIIPNIKWMGQMI